MVETLLSPGTETLLGVGLASRQLSKMNKEKWSKRRSVMKTPEAIRISYYGIEKTGRWTREP